jgi:hypothetical protein
MNSFLPANRTLFRPVKGEFIVRDIGRFVFGEENNYNIEIAGWRWWRLVYLFARLEINASLTPHLLIYPGLYVNGEIGDSYMLFSSNASTSTGLANYQWGIGLDRNAAPGQSLVVADTFPKTWREPAATQDIDGLQINTAIPPIIHLEDSVISLVDSGIIFGMTDVLIKRSCVIIEGEKLP